MDRRRFLQNVAATAAAAKVLDPLMTSAGATPQSARTAIAHPGAVLDLESVNVDGHTLIAEFSEQASGGASGAAWKVYEDLRTRDGAITLIGSNGENYVLPKTAEATFAEEGAPPFLGLNIDEIGLSGRDLLAEKLLASGDDPDPEQVRAAAPPQGSSPQQGQARGRWVTFVGTKEASD